MAGTLTLQESTAWAQTAVDAGDLEALARAIAARRQAVAGILASGQTPPPAVIARAIADGDRLCAALQALKRELVLDSTRLQRIQQGFAPAQPPPVRISLRG
jgi:hypothetical protein